MERLKMALVILGVVFAFMGIRDIYYNSKTPSNFNEMLEADFEKGMIVEGDLYANLGYFEENYTTRNGVKSGNSHYNYMIPVGETQYMGLLNDTTNMETSLNTQAEVTISYMTGETTAEPEPVHFKGRVCKMSDETKGYMREYMVYLGFTEQEVDGYILPYYIKCENYENGGLFALIGLVCLVIGILTYVVPYMNARKNQNVMFANDSNVNTNVDSTYGTTVIEDDFDAFQAQMDNVPEETVQEEPLAYQSAFDDLDLTSNTTSTAGLGEGIANEQPKSGLSLKLKD